MIRLAPCLLAATVLAGLLLAPASAAEPAWILLLKSQSHPIDQRVVKHFEQADLRLVERPLSEPLSQEILRQFNLVMLMDFEGLQPPPLWDPDGISTYYTLKQNLVELQRYVEAGGGLWYSMSVGTGGVATAQALEPLLGRWGAALVPANVRDAAHQADNYCWTTNVAASPVTEGVRRLYYPNVLGRWDDVYSSMPFALTDKRWQPVVRAMPGATSFRCLQYGQPEGPVWFPVEAGAQNPPILAAVAQIGKGRVVLFGVHRIFTLLYPYEPELKGWEYYTGRIDGAVLETGDGTTPSDGLRLMTNMLRWAAESSRALGWGKYTPETYAALPVPDRGEVPQWLGTWNEQNVTAYHKVLIGTRSSYSSGRGSIAEYAAAAKEAGYSVLVMTEDLARFTPEKWEAYYQDCARASTPDLQVIAGLDMEDVFQNRYLVWGQSIFPPGWMLDKDGRRIQQVQYLSFGMGTTFVVIARPGSTPLPQQMYKHFSGLAAFTYRDGKLIDNGLPAYQAQVYNMSLPFPVAVHEVFSPEGVAVAAAGGHQVYLPTDTAQSAAWYLRAGALAHYYEVPNRVVVTSGPMIKALGAGKGHASFTNFVVEGDQPLTDIRYYAQYNLIRRWTPNTNRFEGSVALWPGSRHWGFLWFSDAQGRTAITAGLRTGQGWGFDWRCADRQNFFATAMGYIWNGVPGLDINLPTFGTEEGKTMWPYRAGPVLGENLVPVVEFPYFSPVLGITDAYLDQRYVTGLFEQAGFDAAAPLGTSRSRVYEGRVRYYDWHNALPDPPRGEAPPALQVIDLELRLRKPAYPESELYPSLLNVGPRPLVRYQDAAGAWVSKQLENGYVDLPVGGSAGDLVALSPGLRVVAWGAVGFPASLQEAGPLPVGHSWRARWVRLGTEREVEATVRGMGLTGPAPYGPALTRGKLDGVAYVAACTADVFGVAGEVPPDPSLSYRLPLRIAGLNVNWPTGLWRPAAVDGGLDYQQVPGDPALPTTLTKPEEDLVPFGVFEQSGWALLDVAQGGAFYAGHLVIAGDSRLRISLLRWTAEGMFLEVNNPTDGQIDTTVQTPPEITNRYRLDQKVSVPPGTSQRLQFGK